MTNREIIARAFALLVWVLLLMSGCSLDRPNDGSAAHVRLVGDNSFIVEVGPNLVKELGGPSTQRINSFVDQEITRRGICKSRYTVNSEWLERGGYYYVKGQCL
jgi:hypothetical protein